MLLVVGGIGLELMLTRLVGMDRVLERVYLKIGQGEARLGALARRLVRSGIDHEEQRALRYMLIVMNWQFDDRTAHVRRYADDVGAHVGVVGARVDIVQTHNIKGDHERADDNRKPDDAARPMPYPPALRDCVVFRHRPAQMRLKKIS